MNKKIFVYGVNGFIGSTLKKYLIQNKCEVLNYKVNTKILHGRHNYTKFWKNVIKRSKIIVYASFNNDLSSLKKNINSSLLETLLPLYTLTEVVKNNKNKIKIIYLSSASIYGDKKKLPVNEKADTQITNIYDMLKILSEQILINSKISNLNYCILRLANVYGENISNLNQKNRQILSKIIRLAIKDKYINIYGHGKYYRDYIHIKDVCDVINKSIRSKKSHNQIFNIGSGRKVRLIWLFKHIKKILKIKYGYIIKINKIQIKNNSINNSRNYQSSIAKALKYLNWKPSISLETGIYNLIDFIYYKSLKNKKFNK